MTNKKKNKSLKSASSAHASRAFSHTPFYDVHESEDAFTVHVAVGEEVAFDEIDVETDEFTIFVLVHQHVASSVKHRDHIHESFRESALSYRVPLPSAIRADQAMVSFENGLVEIYAPKKKVQSR
jgi:HSP20 family molecular chaperone IbpA